MVNLKLSPIVWDVRQKPLAARQAEYKICKRRGHQAGSGIGYSEAIQGGKTWYTCKWCGCEFADHVTETRELFERRLPE